VRLTDRTSEEQKDVGTMTHMNWTRRGGTAVFLAALAAAVIATFAFAAQRADAKTVRCDDRAGRTLLANRQVRIFSQQRNGQTRTTVCDQASRRVSYLAEADDFKAAFTIGRLQLAGRYVAVANALRAAGVPPVWSVAVLNARTGRSHDYREFDQPDSGLLAAELTGLALTPSGTAAWMVGSSTGTKNYAVYIGTGATKQVVDLSPDIATDSLATGPSGFYWLNAGTPKYAPAA
jgi:hypothetical protein